jgi:hypothetical protein
LSLEVASLELKMNKRPLLLAFILFLVVLPACAGKTTPVAMIPTNTAVDLPQIISVEMDQTEVPRYESLEIILHLDVQYENPYDAREVAVEGVFTGPNRDDMIVPGFWDGQGAWKIRFTPSAEGEWRYEFFVSDARGRSLPLEGSFAVTSSELHGWIQPGDAFDSSYSSHYFVYHDGTPFYGIGHADALNILEDGFDVEDGVGLFDNMKAARENFVVWWPMYSNSLVASSYDDYSLGNMKTVDLIVKDAEKEGIHLIFTIWDHPNLRDDTHAWGDGNWGRNGFSKLGDVDSFFVSEEAWAWQENLYRYIIARWGYSPAIGMWQTVAEIDGTNSYDQTDPWHAKVNTYFMENDPYHHPTTASKSGDVDWAAGHAAMDAPQVHIYAFEDDAVKSAAIIAGWTETMLGNADKPNWVGEFGVTGNAYYPELFHNAIWAALASGAAMTPAEWNSGGGWGRMTPEMNADLNRLGIFVEDMHLAKLDPSALMITSSDPQVRAWGLAGQSAGLFWVQDYSLEGRSMDEVRSLMTIRSGVQVDVQGLTAGSYAVQPYDPWLGVYLETFHIECSEESACTISLPDFQADMAFKIIQE